MSDLIRQAVAGRRESAAGWVRANCPMCEERVGKIDRHASLSWKPESGWWGCWRCGARGWLELDPDLPAPTPLAVEPYAWDESEFYDPWEDQSGVLARARAYLRKRGILREVCRLAEVRVALQGKYQNRIIIPVRSNDEWVGFAARTYADDEPKVLYPRGMRRDVPLCRPSLLTEETEEPCMVVEGPFDALRHWSCAAAVLGQPTDAHVDLFADVADRRPVVVALDGDAWQAGRDFARRILMRVVRDARELRTRGVGWVRLPPGKDPGSIESTARILSETTWLQRGE